jgi:outer membrane lipoprotein-sorting protein
MNTNCMIPRLLVWLLLLSCMTYAAADSVETAEGTATAQSEAKALPSLRSVFDGFYRENGGRLVHEKLRSFRVIGQLERDDKTFQLWIFRKYPNRFRVVQSGPDGRNIFGYDGTVFWRGFQRDGRLVAVEVIESFNQLELDFEADFYSPLLTLRRLSREMKVVDVEEIDGRKTYVVKGDIQNEVTVRVWVDAEHYQEVRLEFISDEKHFHVEFSDHRKVGEYWFAHSILTVSNDKATYSRVTIDEVSLNPGLFDSFFSPDFSPL